jgi:hypothetical protein
MVDHDVSDIVGKILKLIKPLSSEERKRVIQAALVLLGEAPVVESPGEPAGDHGSASAGASKFRFQRANTWMMQNGVTRAELENVFHIEADTAEIIGTVPGANKRAQTLNAYVLAGLSQLLTVGEASFTDKAARAICQAAGCLDGPNHSRTLTARGNDFAGSKEKGWTLTAPGLKRAATLVKEMASS